MPIVRLVHFTFIIIMGRYSLSISIFHNVTYVVVIANSLPLQADRLKGTWTPLLMLVVATCIMEPLKVNTSTHLSEYLPKIFSWSRPYHLNGQLSKLNPTFVESCCL